MDLYIAFLRSLYIIHQNNHWTCSGPNFYGNHLLFERLYLSAQDNADLAAEKIVGIFGKESVNLTNQAQLINKIVSKYNNENHIVNSLKAETDFLILSEKIYEQLKQTENLTLGLDDAIMAIASKREEAIYLLKQALV